MTDQPACPVCGRPYSPDEAICPECGWQLHGPYILGPITPAIQEQYERDLAQARDAWRLRQRDLDLACIVDLIGDQATVQARCGLVCALVTAIEQRLQHRDPPVTLRIALLAYGDYNHIHAERHRPHPAPLQCYPFTTPASLRQYLTTLEAHRGQDFEAALEDALAAVATLEWRPRSSRYMVTIGHRPPHPYKPGLGSHQLGSPAGYDWQALLQHLRYALQITSIAIVGPAWMPGEKRFPAHVSAYADACWQHIGYSARFCYTTVTPDQIGELCMADDHTDHSRV